MAAGDRLFVSNNHNNTVYSSATILAFPGTLASPNLILCVSDAAAPPTEAAIDDLKRKLDELQNQLAELSKKP